MVTISLMNKEKTRILTKVNMAVSAMSLCAKSPFGTVGYVHIVTQNTQMVSLNGKPYNTGSPLGHSETEKKRIKINNPGRHCILTSPVFKPCSAMNNVCTVHR